jgi:hypothetical protein
MTPAATRSVAAILKCTTPNPAPNPAAQPGEACDAGLSFYSVAPCGAVCQWGFHPRESLTVIATGVRGTVSKASAAGTLTSPLPPLLCCLAPL